MNWPSLAIVSRLREAETLLETLLTSEIYSSDQVAKRHPLKQVKEPFQ